MKLAFLWMKLCCGEFINWPSWTGKGGQERNQVYIDLAVAKCLQLFPKTLHWIFWITALHLAKPDTAVWAFKPGYLTHIFPQICFILNLHAGYSKKESPLNGEREFGWCGHVCSPGTSSLLIFRLICSLSLSISKNKHPCFADRGTEQQSIKAGGNSHRFQRALDWVLMGLLAAGNFCFLTEERQIQLIMCTSARSDHQTLIHEHR